MFDLAGKTILITGASSGLGAHFAGVLAKAGAHLVLAARRAEALQAVARTVSGAGGKVTTAALDVTNLDSIASLTELLSTVDVVINNAGVVRNGAALAQSEADWDDVLDTNLKGMFFLAQASAKAMRDARRPGNIINVASILGLRQAGGVLPYAVSKAGVIQMTKTLALELARFDIRVNALAPGYLETELNSEFWTTEAGQALIRRIPQRRLGQLADLDGPLLLLASDLSRYMTGAVLTVDGGHLVGTL